MDPDRGPRRRQPRAGHRPSVVYVTNELPSVGNNGGQVREIELLRRLSERWSIHLVVTGPSPGLCSAVGWDRPTISDSARCWEPQPDCAPDGFTSRERSVFVPDLKARLEHLVRHTGACLAHFEGYFTALAAVPLSCPTCLVEENVEWTLEEQRNRPAGGCRSREVEQWRRATELVVVGVEDRSIVRSFGMDAEVVPSGADHLHRRPVTARPVPRHFYMVTGSDWWPTVESVDLLVHTIWPEVLRARSDARLSLFGRSSRRYDGWHGGSIEGRGWVPDLGLEMSGHDALLAPVMSGGGVRIKVLEALGVGIPVFTTSEGLRGIPGAAQRGCRIADDPIGLARSVIHAMDDEVGWRATRSAAMEAVRHLSRWDESAELLDSVWARAARR